VHTEVVAMDLIAKSFSFSLVVAFFFSFGWYGYFVNRLWGTPEYGGKRYLLACAKALSTGLLLFLAIFLARTTNTAEETITFGLIFAAPFLLLGWFAHRWRYRRGERRIRDGVNNSS